MKISPLSCVLVFVFLASFVSINGAPVPSKTPSAGPTSTPSSKPTSLPTDDGSKKRGRSPGSDGDDDIVEPSNSGNHWFNITVPEYLVNRPNKKQKLTTNVAIQVFRTLDSTGFKQENNLVNPALIEYFSGTCFEDPCLEHAVEAELHVRATEASNKYEKWSERREANRDSIIKQFMKDFGFNKKDATEAYNYANKKMSSKHQDSLKQDELYFAYMCYKSARASPEICGRALDDYKRYNKDHEGGGGPPPGMNGHSGVTI